MFLLLMSSWMFSFSAPSSPSCITSTSVVSVPPMLHVSCSMLTPSLHTVILNWCPFRIPLHCCALFVLLVFFRWKDALDIIIPSSAGRIFSLSFLFLFFLSLSFHAALLALPSPTALMSPFPFYVFIYCVVYFYTTFQKIFFFLFLIKFLLNFKNISDCLSFFLSPPLLGSCFKQSKIKECNQKVEPQRQWQNYHCKV